MPVARASEVLEWVATNRGADTLGYEVDVTVVFIDSDPAFDVAKAYEYAFHVGTRWPHNHEAMVVIIQFLFLF